jgi:magnesium-protoporphyrin O-methyltransferase
MSCTCGCCRAYEHAFDEEYAQGDLDDYRAKGPERSTRVLLDLIRAATDVRGATVLDIGGGVGGVHHELLKDGAMSAVGVEGSSAYIAASKREAERLNHADRIAYLHGDFVDLAVEVAPADIVALDRVICCYPDMGALVGAAASKAQRVIGLVWPRDAWWMQVGLWGFNVFERFSKYPLCQSFHRVADVDRVIGEHGLRVHAGRNVGLWHARVYVTHDRLRPQ